MEVYIKLIQYTLLYELSFISIFVGILRVVASSLGVVAGTFGHTIRNRGFFNLSSDSWC